MSVMIKDMFYDFCSATLKCAYILVFAPLKASA